MVRLANLADYEVEHLLSKNTLSFDAEPFVEGPPLGERRVAIISTAGLHPADQATFNLQDTGYRVIPGSYDADQLVMSHASVNFDRTGFQQDVNICFPLDRLRELAQEGVIGSVADFHYTVSGATDPSVMEDTARDMARQMKADAVDTVLLVPI